jgi:preprotein translocase subunit SecA
MLGVIKSDVVTDLSRVHIPTPEELAEMEAQQQQQAESMKLSFEHDDVDGLTGEVTASQEALMSRLNNKRSQYQKVVMRHVHVVQV